MENDHATKLAAARTRLILDKPFLGALVLRLPMQEADPSWCSTTATDARKLFYNPQYINALSVNQVQFVLAHEALHCALSHFARRTHRVKLRWDLACDYAINPLLKDDGLTTPPDLYIDDSFKGMTAEEIYPYIDENTEDEPMDGHLYDESENQDPPPPPPESNQEGKAKQSEPSEQASGDSAAQPPPPLTEQEREQLSVQWQQRLAGAAQQALQAGKMGDTLARMIDHLLQPQLPWRMLLARYMSGVSREEYSYMRPSRREGAAIFPSLRGHQMELSVALDVSGSIKEREIAEFLAEINAIKAQIRARITLHACDASLAEDGPWIYEPWENFQAPKHFKGGGGTSFVPVFAWHALQTSPPDLLVYFTDAQGRFPPQEPNYPVLWLVKGKTKIPWGQRIQLN